jgi:hypothetical protein
MSIFETISQSFSYVATSIKTIMLFFYELFASILKYIYDPEIQKDLFKYGFALGFVILSTVILYYAANDKEALMSRTYLYFFLAVIPLVIAMRYVFPAFNLSNNPFYKIFIIVFVVIIFSALFYSYAAMSATTSLALSILINFILFIIITFGLGIFFIIFGNYLKSLTGIQGFIVYLIFYIPCLVVDFFRYVLKEFKTTTNDVYILFLLELAFILLYIYIPKLITYLSTKNGIILLEGSKFLDTELTVDNSKIIIHPSKDVLSYQTTLNFRKNYAISLWTYLNNESISNNAYSKESLIFSYGRGMPMITYHNPINKDDNNAYLNSDKYTIYFTNNKKNSNVEISKKISLPSQKWNNLVFNYYSDHADLFVNGNLELTFTFDSTNRPIYKASDLINMGSTNGLNGAICNIRYYTEPLSKASIVGMYNLLMYKNPPTFS